MNFLVRTAALAGGLISAACGAADAQSFPGEYFAVINGNTGNTVRGSGVDTSSRTAAGVYQISFNRTMAACAFTASLSGQAAGQLTVSTEAGSPARLVVRTFNVAGLPANRGFQVIALCAPGASPN